MIGRISVAAIAICIGACASSGPEAPAATASVDAVAPEEAVAPAEDGIHELDAPNVEMAANAAPESDEDEIVCRKEELTGSRMVRKVCRRRSDIDARAAEDQDMMRNMRYPKTGSQAAMEGTAQ